MRLHEFEAKRIFREYEIPVPKGRVVKGPKEAKEASVELGLPVVLKAQVLVGGRGLAGGIVVCNSQEEVEAKAKELFSKEIKGLLPEEILVEEKLPVKDEIYLGVTVDGYEGRPVLLLSKRGGVNVERLAKEDPTAIISFPLPVFDGMYAFQARNLARDLGYGGATLIDLAKVIHGLVRVFYDYQALIAEINPVAVLEDGSVSALDAVLELDNSALKRLGKEVPSPTSRIKNPLERKGREIGVTYVDLEGDVGIISSGAGLGMTSMDIIGSKLRPANFLETGGGITEDLLYKCMDLVTQKPNLRAILINVYGGINPIHEGAKGVVRFIKERGLNIPIVAKALGNRQAETWEILKEGGIHVVTETATEKAVERLYQILTGKEER